MYSEFPLFALKKIDAVEVKRSAAIGMKNSVSQRYAQSSKFLDRAESVIPLASQTFSKSRTQFPPGFAPLFVERGRGGRVWDIDGNEYVDLICGLMPVVLGYCDSDVDAAIRRQLDLGITFSLSTKLETELAERLVEIIPCAEMARFGKNGSDVTSAAVRLARAYTGRDRIIAIGYHGWQDWYIGSTTINKGIPKAVQSLTHKLPFNDLGALKNTFDLYPGEVAGVIVEPMNAAEPEPGYLEGLRHLATQNGTVLIFDEVVTGFRFALGGAQELFGISPDLAVFGKAMGNGMPISAVVGSADIMREMEEIFYSGTFGGETLSIAAAITVIDKLRNESVLQHIWEIGGVLRKGLNERLERHGLQNVIKASGKDPWVILGFSDHPSAEAAAIKTLFIVEMLKRGVLIQGSHNICFAHDSGDVSDVLSAYDETLPLIAEKLETGTLVADLMMPIIRPIFQVRG